MSSYYYQEINCHDHAPAYKSLHLLIVLLIFFENVFQFTVYTFYDNGFGILCSYFYKFIMCCLTLLLISARKYQIFKVDVSLLITALILIFTGIITGIEYGSEINFLKLIYSMVIMWYSFYSFKYNEINVVFALRVVFILNMIFVALQFLGAGEYVYYHQQYSYSSNNAAVWMQNTSELLPLQQLRPSGLFTSTIYLTLFALIFFGHTVFSLCKKNKTGYYLIGFAMPFMGSSASIILIIISLIALFHNKKMLYYFLGSLSSIAFIYYYYFPFFNYNFNMRVTLTSIVGRITANSFIAQNSIISIVVILLLISIAVNAMFKHYKYTSFVIILSPLVLMPLFLHPIIFDPKYSFLLGMLSAYYCKYKINTNQMSRRRAMNNYS
jgi:hypothetical protein